MTSDDCVRYRLASIGLEDPGDTGCVGVPILEVSQGCVHEHIAVARVCYACLTEMLSYEPDPGEWGCGPCAALGHSCGAPLVIRELVTGGTS